MANTYSKVARGIHWFTALAIFTLAVLGFWMTDRSSANVWDSLTNTLYEWHKLIGFLVLIVTVARFTLRINSTTPAYSPTLSPLVLKIATAVHITLYGLLFAVPMLGWAGVTAYPALITIGGYSLPAMPGIEKNELLAKQLFQIHGLLAITLIAIATLHIMAAINHLLIKKDGVFQRMWFKAK